MHEGVEKYLSGYKERIDRELSVFLKRAEKEHSLAPFGKTFFNAVAEFTLRGGKRIRGALVLLGYKGFHGRTESAVLGIAAAIELIHSFLLIHDDIIDRDALRRGKPTLHKVFECRFPRQTRFAEEKRHFGVSLAITAGDLVAVLAYESIVKSGLSLHIKKEVLQETNKLLFSVIQGEAEDVVVQYQERATVAGVQSVYTHKTALYSFWYPLALGGLIAGAPRSKREALKQYAMPLGIAFQIQDDILGVFGDAEKTGKPAGSDIREGKKTLLVLETLKRGNAQQQKLLLRTLGNERLKPQELDAVRDIFRETGAFAACVKHSQTLVKKAQAALPKLGLKKSVAAFLFRLAAYIIEREQ